ncbi:unnamed protein product [Rotaria magnacalcarata]|uniref:Uncharacterized protein n=1 Tax=Rotaria magnacalcarata TaxID=392030 RepID=A0A8S2KX41_9BILA|nr:unnamed protein product [Rotaria magnacalcarata]
MFAGAQIVTTKLVPASKRQQIVDEQNEDKTIQDLVNVTVMVPRKKAVIDVESPAEKFERKVLAHERKNERTLEQKQLTQHMENLMEKVF